MIFEYLWVRCMLIVSWLIQFPCFLQQFGIWELFSRVNKHFPRWFRSKSACWVSMGFQYYFQRVTCDSPPKKSRSNYHCYHIITIKKFIILPGYFTICMEVSTQDTQNIFWRSTFSFDFWMLVWPPGFTMYWKMKALPPCRKNNNIGWKIQVFCFYFYWKMLCHSPKWSQLRTVTELFWSKTVPGILDHHPLILEESKH